MEKLRKKHAEKIRYLLVGGFNTLLDFVLLFTFVALGVDKILANYFSTGVSMIVSFFINKSFTLLYPVIFVRNSLKVNFLSFIFFIVLSCF